MKKLIMSLVFAGMVGTGLANATIDDPCKHNCDKNKVTHNKATQNKPVHKTEKGVKHGAYDVSHNKITKGTHINNGNKKYKHQDDI